MINNTTGVIDIGSNSVRLLLEKEGNVIYKDAIVTRLSEKMSLDRVLTKVAIERTINALSFFRDKAIAEGVANLYVFATAAVRLAKNKDEFLSIVKEKLGLEIDVVSGELEATLGKFGALGDKDGGLIDVGGKSTEVAVCKNGETIFVKSLNLGIVSLTEKFSQSVIKCKKYCKNFIKENLLDYNIKDCKFYSIGGTITSLSAMCLGLKKYDRNKVDLSVLTLKSLKKLIAKIKSTPVQLRTQVFCLQKGREDVILSGAVLFYVLMKFLKIKSLVVRDSDNLEGYLIYKRKNRWENIKS